MRPLPYRDGDTGLTGYLAYDDASPDKRPGILIVHGGAGLDDHAKGQARRYAALGYVALACDIFGEGVAGNRDRVMACLIGLRDDPELLFQRGRAGVTALASRPRSTDGWPRWASVS